MGALLSRCFDWRCDPDPISCRLLCSKTTGNRQRQLKQQLQQQQQQQQTRKVSQESSCSASGAGAGAGFHVSRKAGHVSFGNPHGHQPQQPPLSTRSKEPGWPGIHSDSPPPDHPPTPKFLLVHHHHQQQGHAFPESAAAGPGTYGSCSFSYPQPAGGGGAPESRQQSAKHLQCKDDSGIGRVRRTFSFRQGTTARPDGCDAGTNTRRSHNGGTRGQSFKMAD